MVHKRKHGDGSVEEPIWSTYKDGIVGWVGGQYGTKMARCKRTRGDLHRISVYGVQAFVCAVWGPRLSVSVAA
jgi:hypothetical protein